MTAISEWEMWNIVSLKFQYGVSIPSVQSCPILNYQACQRKRNLYHECPMLRRFIIKVWNFIIVTSMYKQNKSNKILIYRMYRIKQEISGLFDFELTLFKTRTFKIGIVLDYQ